MPILYISGRFSSDDILHGIDQNILTASRYALEAWRKGWAVICPHKNTSGYQHTDILYSVWMNGDLAFIDRMCPEKGDALYMLPNWELSKGAVIERDFAISRGLKIYYNDIPVVNDD